MEKKLCGPSSPLSAFLIPDLFTKTSHELSSLLCKYRKVSSEPPCCHWVGGCTTRLEQFFVCLVQSITFLLYKYLGRDVYIREVKGMLSEIEWHFAVTLDLVLAKERRREEEEKGI